MVQQAYAGFLAYEPLYHAGCLQDSSTGSYCFADAVTNSSAPSSSYVYYLPLGVSLPAASSPACTECLQNTMAIFAAAAGNASQPVSGDYAGAAGLIDKTCGDAFVNGSVAVASAARSLRHGNSVSGLGSVALLAVVLFLML